MPTYVPLDLSQPYTRFGITIGRLKLEEIETVRRWRTHPDIARFMLFRDDITPEQQLAWFTSIDNRHNMYGSIYWHGEFIGVTNLRDIDHEAATAEGGMFIWSAEHQNSLVPFRAAVVATDLAFWGYGFQRITARMLATNRRAIRFNRTLGYVFDAEPSADGVVTGWLSNASYWPATLALRELLDRQDGTINGGTPIPPLP